MSLVLNAIPDHQSQIRSLQQELYQRNRQLNEATDRIRDLEAELRQTRLESDTQRFAIKSLRETLAPLYKALGAIFGEIDALGTVESSAAAETSVPRRSSPVWDSWKNRLGGASAKIIDILMLHGELTQEQIRIHVGTNRKQTIYDAISKLNKAGIINKRDGRISLKEL